MTYRVELAGAALQQFHTLPANGRDAVISRAADLVDAPWDAQYVEAGGTAESARETVFGDGDGILDFEIDEAARLIKIIRIVWLPA